MHFLFIWFGLYWLPAIVALVRHSPSAPGIAVFNFFLGWTGIGWIVALVWALASAPTPQINVYIDGNRATISK